MRNKTGFIIFFLAAMAALATLALVEPSWAGKLEEAIAKTPVGTGPGMIHPDMPKGFMGIPGAPASFLAVLHPVGRLGRLDFLLGGRLRRRHGRGGAYLGFRSVGLCRDL